MRALREIVRLRFGLDRGEPRTLDQVGQRVNLTRERTPPNRGTDHVEAAAPIVEYRRSRSADRLIRPRRPLRGRPSRVTASTQDCRSECIRVGLLKLSVKRPHLVEPITPWTPTMRRLPVSSCW
ncbi:MAG TPA: sigma factor-like helix-turn-helix DNA-binding protein [Acidimicrobiales bacterium]|nr:sigma factor-like helix-turn-helix DNA-binding protein [Acidimicrobiales bacterium]